MKTYLIIQTAFIGDVILATALIESIHAKEPDAKIDFLLRKGNESLLSDHPLISEVLIWDKQNSKYQNLKMLALVIKAKKYDFLLNLQRFGSTGYLSWKSKAKVIVGFRKNPFSFVFTHKVNHEIGNGRHEVERNHDLLTAIGNYPIKRPKLYPSKLQKEKVNALIKTEGYIVLAPASVWQTKQLPKEKWVALLNLNPKMKVYLIGSKSDANYLNEIGSMTQHENWVCLAGELNLLEAAFLISKAQMTHVNDSAPLHLASAMNAPVTAYFCSTLPSFGFGPLSDNSVIVETTEHLDCRPCGLHGKSSCPKGHFKCGYQILVTK